MLNEPSQTPKDTRRAMAAIRGPSSSRNHRHRTSFGGCQGLAAGDSGEAVFHGDRIGFARWMRDEVWGWTVAMAAQQWEMVSDVSPNR